MNDDDDDDAGEEKGRTGGKAPRRHSITPLSFSIHIITRNRVKILRPPPHFHPFTKRRRVLSIDSDDDSNQIPISLQEDDDDDARQRHYSQVDLSTRRKKYGESGSAQ